MSIQQFLTTLHKHTEDKKGLLNDRYQENSVWLSNEFELILKLIRQDSKENNSDEAKAEIVVQNAPQFESSGDNSEKLIDFKNKKRKSPESALSSSNMSPELKRQSVDIEKLQLDAGLPANFSGLTIKILGEELKNRGKPETVKGWKRADYMAALNDALLEEASLKARNDKQNPASVAEPEPEPVAAVLFTNFPPTTPGKGPRKIGSTMGDFRSKMNQDAAAESLSQPPAVVELDVNEKARIEFMRRRESQQAAARKSQAVKPPAEQETTMSVAEDAETIVVDEVDGGVDADAESTSVASLSLETASVAAVEEQEDDDNEMVTSPSAKGSMFMDIASPVPPERPVHVEAPASAHKMTTQEDDEVEVVEEVDEEQQLDEVNIDSEEEAVENVVEETSVDVSAESVEEEEEDKEEEVSPESAVEEEDVEIVQSMEQEEVTPAVMTASQNDTQDTIVLEYSSPVQQQEDSQEEETVSPITEVVIEEVAAVVVAAPVVVDPIVVKPVVVTAPAMVLVKKPLNLMASIDKAPVVPAKTVVPALEKAKQLKAAEDAKLAAKKKEMELKLAASKELRLAAAAKSAAVVAPKVAVKPSTTAPVKMTSSKENASVASGSVAAMAANLNSQNASAVSGSAKEKEAKKGILGTISTVLNFGKKTPTKPVQQSEASASTSSSSKTTFDISVVETAKPVEAPAAVVKAAGFSTLQSKTAAPVAAVVTPSKKPDLFGDKAKMTAILNSYNAVSNQQSMAAAIAAPPPIVDLHKAAAVAFNKPVPVVAVMQSPAPKAPLNSGSVLRDITEKIVTGGNTSHAVTPGQKTAPAVQEAAPASTEYQIEDRESSDEENDSGTDEEDGDKKKAAQSVPEWAKGANLKASLEKQYGMHGHTAMDPDTIFHEVQTCNLEEIFGAKEGHNRKYAKRTSSAHWEADQLTLVEKRAYRNHMGFAASARPSAVN